MLTRIQLAGLVVAMVGAACGGAGSPTADGQGGAALQAIDREVTAALDTYSAGVAAAPDAAACQAAKESYQATMKAALEELTPACADLDRQMVRAGGHPDEADLGCVAAAMAMELTRHGECACTEASVAAAEAAAHVARMNRAMEHQRRRAGLGGGQAPVAGQGSSCQAGLDGSFTVGGQRWSPGTCPASACAASCDCGQTCMVQCAGECSREDATCLAACQQTCTAACKSTCWDTCQPSGA